MNIRECKLCHNQVDFDEPWCDHETMEESAWLDIRERQKAAALALTDSVIDAEVRKAAEELGARAAADFHKMLQRVFDAEEVEQHLSDLDHVYQHRSQQ